MERFTEEVSFKGQLRIVREVLGYIKERAQRYFVGPIEIRDCKSYCVPFSSPLKTIDLVELKQKRWLDIIPRHEPVTLARIEIWNSLDYGRKIEFIISDYRIWDIAKEELQKNTEVLQLPTIYLIKDF